MKAPVAVSVNFNYVANPGHLCFMWADQAKEFRVIKDEYAN